MLHNTTINDDSQHLWFKTSHRATTNFLLPRPRFIFSSVWQLLLLCGPRIHFEQSCLLIRILRYNRFPTSDPSRTHPPLLPTRWYSIVYPCVWTQPTYAFCPRCRHHAVHYHKSLGSILDVLDDASLYQLEFHLYSQLTIFCPTIYRFESVNFPVLNVAKQSQS